MKKVIYVFMVMLGMIQASESSASIKNQQEKCVIEGRISDKTNGEALVFATVALRQLDSTVVSACTTGEDGAYRMEALRGKYILEAALVGYKTFTTEVNVPATLDINMEQDNEMLEGAVVTDRVKLVEMKLDKVVMNVSQSAFAQGSNGLELLKKAPGVTIDKDGNVMLNGKSVAVWIDGRPSYMDGKALESLLRSTSGDSIDKFELMEHPSSKYDAAGQGGIINIKTKKNFAQGFNGSLGLDAGGMNVNKYDDLQINENSYANFAYRGKKTNTFVNLYQGHFDTGCLIGTNTIKDLPGGELNLNTESYQNFGFRNWQVKVGNDWFINDKNIFGVILTLPGSKNLCTSDPEFNHSIQSFGDYTEITDTKTKGDSRMGQVNGNMNYTHVFDESRSAELTANLDWYRSTADETSLQDNHITSTLDPVGWMTNKTINSSNLINIYSAKIDYQTVLWQKAMFESGAKWAMSVTDNDLMRKETGIPDENTLFRYREHIGAAYATFAAQLNPKFSLKAGLRGEYTNSFGDWKTAGSKTLRSYFNLFPTVFLGYNPSEKVRLAASYTRRITRPNYSVMNPAESYINAHTTLVGNPEIMPQYSDGVSLNGGFGQHISLGLSFQHDGNLTVQVPSIKENGDVLYRFDNFGYCNYYVASGAISSLPVFKWLDWTLNMTAMYLYNVGADDFVNEGLTWNAYTSLTFNLPKEWKIEWDARYTSKMAYGYFIVMPQFTSDIGVKKQLIPNKLTLSMQFDDVFGTYSSDLKLLGMSGADSSVEQKYYARSIKLGFAWNFGHAQQTRYRKVGELEEASRIGKQK